MSSAPASADRPDMKLFLMWFWFKSKGGYKPVELGHGEEADPGF